MARPVYNITYHGLDEETRIDCLEAIRRSQNPSSPYDCFGVNDLCKSNRSTSKDANNAKKRREPGKFVPIDLGPIFGKEEPKEQTYKDTLKVDVQPKPLKHSTPTNESTIKKKRFG